MKHPAVYSLFIITLFIWVSPAWSRPMAFNEVSLLVRMHENESSIKDEVSSRKLMHPLTPQQESTLKAQGASDSLVSSLRNSNLVASKDEVAAVENRDGQPAMNAREDMSPAGHQHVHVFNAAFGHPINLSQWGGLSYEIVFNSYRSAGEDYVEPFIVDDIRTVTEVSRMIPLISEGEAFTNDWYPRNEVRNWRFTPYDARGDGKDNRFNFSDTVAIRSNAAGRPIRIDWDSPVFFEGQPYTFYPVYGAGGVSLYYICKSTESTAKLAVVTHRR